MSWSRLIRFIGDNGQEAFGEPLIENEAELTERLSRDDLWVTKLEGGDSPVSSFTKGDPVHVKSLQTLLRESDVPIIRCIGLNYIKHSMSGPFHS